ncbi:High-affinity nicotinic acid transporter, partial [Marasmius crinis-equi]
MEHSVKSTEEIDTLSKQASRPRSLLKEEDALDKDAASSSQHSQRIMTSVDKSKLLWKIDMHLVPPLCLVYLLAFLDRVNMGNAVLFGLQEDLGLQGNQYNTALVI